MIDGGVTISIDLGDSDATISELVHNATKEAMENDDLLSYYYQEVEKVKYLEDEDQGGTGAGIGPGPTPAPAPVGSGDPTLGLGIGFGLLALLLGGGLIAKKRKGVVEMTDDGARRTDRGLGLGFGGLSIPSKSKSRSFVGPDAANLGKHASCMDVHECKSAMCSKCYVDRSVMFVDAPVTPRPPPSTRARAFDEVPSGYGWSAKESMDSSSFESSSTTEFY